MRSFLIAFSLLLSGCGNTSNHVPQSEIDAFTPSWENLADGSVFAITTANKGERETATRCWPAEDQTYSCLYVSEERNILHIALHNETEPPDRVFAALGGDGYTCSTETVHMERIVERGETLDTNAMINGRTPWSADYVNDFIANNNVEGTAHYDCFGILRAVNTGSLRSIATTKVTAEMIR